MKKIAKLNDVAFHLINKVNKKKLKINTLLIKNWEKIFGSKDEKNKKKTKKKTRNKETKDVGLSDTYHKGS